MLTESFTGLFAPREGQQHREEQRRRRSLFDRGTPGAEYEANVPHSVESSVELSSALAMLRGHAHQY